jgi:hypothetical protein
MSQAKPRCDVSKCDGNMYLIHAKARSVLVNKGMIAEAEKLYTKFWAAGSREKMLGVLDEFVTVEGLK